MSGRRKRWEGKRGRRAPNRPTQKPRLATVEQTDTRRHDATSRPRKRLYWALPTLASIVALMVAVRVLVMFVGAVPIRVPGLRGLPLASGSHAAHGAAGSLNGWLTRGAVDPSNLASVQVAGRSATPFDAHGLSAATKGFVYRPGPFTVRRGSRLTAQLYVPAGAPVLLATAYLLDGSWTWHSGGFPLLLPNRWTTVSSIVPSSARLPIHEIGLMVLGTKGSKAYSGPLYIDLSKMAGR